MIGMFIHRIVSLLKFFLHSGSALTWTTRCARASELIICFNIKSAGCDLVGRHRGK